jgi:hypothetical protein
VEPARILGQTDVERIEAHILTLRRLTEFALMAAERLHREEEKRAEAHPAADDVAGPPAAEVSVSFHRYARMVRFNIALEQKLIEELRHPAPRSPASPRQTRQSQKQAEQAALLAGRRVEVEHMVENCAATDATLDRERYDELTAELRRLLESGALDEQLLTKDPKTVGWTFMLNRKISPDWSRLFDDEMAARDAGRPEPTYPPPPASAAPHGAAPAVAETPAAAETNSTGTTVRPP